MVIYYGNFRLAAEALLEEAKVGAKRAEIMGPSGWIKPKENVNKRFLHSTLRNAVLSNKKRIKKENLSKPPTTSNGTPTSEINDKNRDS